VKLTDKRAVVFGGTSGIGAATVTALEEAGATVIAASRTSSTHPVDLLDREALTRFFVQNGPFDVLVNSAVPSGRVQGPFPELDLDGFQATFNKFWGYLHSVRLGLQHLTEQASIVLVSGFPARKCKPGASAISTVGNTVEGFVRAIAPEIAPRRINAVSPGLIDTPLFPQEGEERKEFLQRAVHTHAIPRPGQAEEVASAILFLIQNEFTTGTVVDVDGGALLP